MDRKALQGALVNLLENAWHFSAAGDVLRLSVESQDAALLFRVEDAGPGLDPEQLDKMFEPFFTTRPGGTGLGLAIVKKVVDELGGQVRCFNRGRRGVL